MPTSFAARSSFRRPMRALALCLPLAIAAAACGKGGDQHEDTASAAAPQASAAPAEPKEMDWCASLPAQDVAATLQRTVGKGVSITKPSAGGGCSYRDVEQGPPEVQVLVEAVDAGSDSAATESVAGVRSMFTDRNQAVSDLPGVGDAAFGAWEAEAYGVKFRKGRYTGGVTVNARSFKDPKVEQAAQELAKQVVSKLS